MIALATVVLQMIVGVGKYLYAKREEKDQAMKDLVKIYKDLDKTNKRVAVLRNKYQEARDRMRRKPPTTPS